MTTFSVSTPMNLTTVINQALDSAVSVLGRKKTEAIFSEGLVDILENLEDVQALESTADDQKLDWGQVKKELHNTNV